MGSSSGGSGVAFALMTRGKGNKTQVRQIEVPAEAGIAVRSKERVMAENEERERVKE